MGKHIVRYWVGVLAYFLLLSHAFATPPCEESSHTLLRSYPENGAEAVPIDTALAVSIAEDANCGGERQVEFSIVVTEEETEVTIPGDWSFNEQITGYREPVVYSSRDDAFCFYDRGRTHLGIWKPASDLKPMTTYKMVITVSNWSAFGDDPDERTTVLFTTGMNQRSDEAPTLTELTLEHEVVEITAAPGDSFGEACEEGKALGSVGDFGDDVVLLPRSKATVKTTAFEPWWRYWLVVSIEAPSDGESPRAGAGRLESTLETSRIFTTPNAWPEEACARARATDLFDQTVVFESETCSALPRQPGDAAMPTDEPIERTAGGTAVTERNQDTVAGQNQTTVSNADGDQVSDSGCACDSTKQADVFGWGALLLFTVVRQRRRGDVADG
ncbi:MAG: hypothetical protein VX589_14150 [Myxococcota bacterium]|nr:hypothetical protein [Myxococcota bacterium]